MMKQTNNYYFWLGPDGELDVVTKEQFEQRQKDWQGERLSDHVQE